MKRVPKRKKVNMQNVYAVMEKADIAARKTARPVRMATSLSALGRGILAA